MAILYKGYAQEKGFGANLVNVPDPSKKIREQGLVAMAHMKDQIAWNNKQSQRFVSQLESNATQEAKAHETAFNIGQDISETVANQKWANFESRIKIAESKRAAKTKQVQDLLNLTTTGAKLWKQYDAKLKNDADQFALGLYDQHGIGLKKLNAIKDISAEIWNDSAKREAALRAAGLDGVPSDVLDRVRSAGSYRSIAIAKQDARRFAMAKPAYYAEHYSTELEVGGVRMSLENAVTSAQVETVLQQLDAQHRREMGPNAPSSKMLALGGGFALMDNARAAVLRGKREDLKAESEKKKYANTKLLLNDFMGPNERGLSSPGAGALKTIHYLAGHTEDSPASREALARARQDVVGALIHGLEEDDFTWDEVKDLENTPIPNFKGGGSPTFGSLYKKDWAKIEDAGIEAAKREQARANVDLIAHNADDLKFKSELLNIAATDPSASTWSKYHSIAIKNNWPQAATFASNQLTRGQSANGDADSIADVKERLARNEHIPIEELQKYGASPTALATMSQLVNEASPWLPEAGGNGEFIDDTVDAYLNNIIPENLLGPDDPTRGFAKRAAVSMARAQYHAARKKGMSHDDALAHSLSYLEGKMFSKDKNNLFKKEWNENTNQHEFGGFSLNRGQVDAIEIDNKIISTTLFNKPNAIYNQPFIAKGKLARKAELLQQGRHQEILPRSTFISYTTKGNVPALKAEMAQIEYYNKLAKENGDPLIPQYPKWYQQKVNKAYEGITQDQYRLLESYNYCDVNKAACNSGMNPIYQRPSMVKARTILSETLGTGENYNSTEKGSSIDRSDLGFSLTGTTLRQIIQLQEAGSIVTVGRYQFDLEALQQAIQTTGMPLDNKFTEDNQDILFDSYFKTKGSEISSNVKNEETRFLLQNIHESTNSDKLSSLGFHNPSLLSAAAYAELNRRNRYAA